MNLNEDWRAALVNLRKEIGQLRLLVEANRTTLAEKDLPRQIVTLLQVADAIDKSKATLTRYSLEPEFPAPLNPDRKNGQAAFYDWLEVREFLLKRTGVFHPVNFSTLFLG